MFNSQWLGGNSTTEDWVEIFPYVIAGYVPQAIQLNDPEQLAVCEQWINTILANAQPDGWLGPMNKVPHDMVICCHADGYYPMWLHPHMLFLARHT